MMKWFDNFEEFEEDLITNKIQRFQHPKMEVVFLLNNNNGSDTDMRVGPSFFTTPPHSFMVVVKVTTVYIKMSYSTITQINTALHRQS